MSIFNRCKAFLAASAGIVILAFLFGCQGGFMGERAEEEQVVARVNDYEIYASDFAYVADRTFAYKEFYLRDSAKAKENALEHLITRKVMVQEAQKQNFDKQKTFMKEIERYWEQALLKFLIKKKSEGLVRAIQVDDEEIKDVYGKKNRKNLAELVVLSDQLSAEQLSASSTNFNLAKQKLMDKIVSAEPAQWWEYGELPAPIEDQLFTLKPGDISSAVKFKDKWVVTRLIETEEVEMPPLEDVSSDLKEEIARKKAEKMLDEWIVDLRKNAKIKVNYEVLEEIELEKIKAAK